MEATIKRSGAKDRRCQYAKGCTTELSTYNSGYLCWTHSAAMSRARFENAISRMSLTEARAGL